MFVVASFIPPFVRLASHFCGLYLVETELPHPVMAVEKEKNGGKKRKREKEIEKNKKRKKKKKVLF